MIQQSSLILSESVIHDLKTLAIQGYPFEVCGVVCENEIIRQHANTFPGDRTHAFDMEIDLSDKSIKAIWHSHPDGPAGPSTNDIPCMESLASHGYNYPWLIVTPQSVTEWICESVSVAS